VERTALLDRLVAASEPVIAVTAPPGYGKTTLLDAWARRRGGRVAWVSCDQVRDDPGALWSAMASALGPRVPLTELAPVGAVDDPDLDVLLTQRAGVDGRGVALVLDGLEAVRSSDTWRLVRTFARTVPEGWTLVLASREELPLPTSRMRVERRLLEVGTDDLAMSVGEAAELVAGAGAELSRARTSELVWRTEGWPAALYLAAEAARAGDVTSSRPFSGSHRLMRDYVGTEVLDRLTKAQRRLLLRTAVLERVNAPLGDALAETRTAGRVLRQLEARTLLVRTVDQDGQWYRCHPLLREALLAELNVDGPDLISHLHARAAAWFEENGETHQAIDHSYLAGDVHGFGRLVLVEMQQVWARGQIDTVLHWMEQLGARSRAPHTAAMVAHGALVFALLGRPGDAERWAAVAESLPATGLLPNGDSVAGTLAYLRANLCRHGPATMREDAVQALRGLGPDSPYRATMVHTEGLSSLMEGDLDRADASFAHAFDLASSIENAPLAAMVLAERCQAAEERGDWAAAETFAGQALALVGHGPFDDYWTSALVFASAARTAVHRGDTATARELTRRAARLRPLLTYAIPVVSLQALLELGRTYLALVDPEGARAVLVQALGILQQRPELGTLATAAHDLDARVGQITTALPLGASTLTAAELRLLPLLPTHLTYAEMGEQLFISRHTVKTHAGSVYRKLGASSRKEAVDRITELGLL
jgi:LuxR family maltose regulon positive regulatory protein